MLACSLPPRLRGLLWTEERGGCDYGFRVYAMGMVKVWAKEEATGIQGGETRPWMHASENMIGDSSQKSFGLVSRRRERAVVRWKWREPFITPFLRSPQRELALLGYKQGKRG